MREGQVKCLNSYSAVPGIHTPVTVSVNLPETFCSPVAVTFVYSQNVFTVDLVYFSTLVKGTKVGRPTAYIQCIYAVGCSITFSNLNLYKNLALLLNLLSY